MRKVISTYNEFHGVVGVVVVILRWGWDGRGPIYSGNLGELEIAAHLLSSPRSGEKRPSRQTVATVQLWHLLCWTTEENFIYTCTLTRCLKITEKVSFNIASEASFFYILTVLPDRSILIGQKLVENSKIKMIHFGNFQTMCCWGFRTFILNRFGV